VAVKPAAAAQPRGLARDCGELATAIAIARDTIGRGGTADLDALARRLGELLDAVAAAPGAKPELHRRELLALAEEIEALGSVIDAERLACSERLAKGDASARVAAAYSKTTRF
jgi:hypothetical protein